jgi:hypothetical protein
MKLGYYQPINGGESTASGLSSLGKTMSDLGQLSIDEKDKKAKALAESERMTLLKNADTRANGELKLGQDKLAFQKEETQAEKLQKAIKSKNRVAAIKIAHPRFSEAVIAAVGEDGLMTIGDEIEKYIPKDRKVGKIDPRITPDGTKYLTFFDEQGNTIKEVDMGKVKTDWNESKDKGSSELPKGTVAVPLDFASDHWHSGAIAQTKDGRFYTKIEDHKKLNDNSYYPEKRAKQLQSKSFNLNLEEDEY